MSLKPRSCRGVSPRSCPTQCPGPSCCSKGSIQQQQHWLLLRFNLWDPGGQSCCSLGGQERSVCQWHNWLITTSGDGAEIYWKATPSVFGVAPMLLLPSVTSHTFWPLLCMGIPRAPSVSKASTGNWKAKAQHRQFCLAAGWTNPFI